MDINQIFENNQHWVAQKLDEDKDYFKKLSQGQNPDILYIGCSDSRATAENLTGAAPGDMFVHRNIANVVSNTDVNALSVINYAVCHLNVPHIVICGHYNCGGVKAAMESDNLGILNPWLKNIRDVYRLHKDELDALTDTNKKYKRFVELNVQEQCINTIKIPEVQKAYNNDELTIHGWVFDIHSGKLIDLNINFDEISNELMDIYRLS